MREEQLMHGKRYDKISWEVEIGLGFLDLEYGVA